MFYVKEPSFLTDVGIRSCSLRTTGRINPSPPILSLRGLKNMFVSRSLSLWFLSLEWYWHLFYEVYFWEKDVEQIKVFFVVVVFFFLIPPFLWPFFWPQVKMSHHPHHSHWFHFKTSSSFSWSAAKLNLSPQCHFLTASVSITLYVFPWLQKSIDHYKSL